MLVSFDKFRLAVGCLFACMVIGVAAVTALTVRSRTIKNDGINSRAAATVSRAATSAPLQIQSPIARLEMERITITPTGFEPKVITRGPGRFLLAVDNRSGLDNLTLHLESQAGRLRTQRASRSKASWRELLDLLPEEYLLKESNHPGWSCRITIAAN